MSDTLGVVDLSFNALGAGRLASRRFAGLSMIEWVARRVTDVQGLSQVVAVLSDIPEHQALRKLVPSDIPLHVSSQGDSLSRLAEVCTHYSADAVVHVPVDSPFVDPTLVDQLIVTARRGRFDFVGFCTAEGDPVMSTRLGLVAEWCRCDAVREANRRATGAQRQPTLRYVWSHPESFKLDFAMLPASLDCRDIRLAIEHEEDWEHAHVIYEALAPGDIDWRRIARLLDEQPAIRERMAALNQKVPV